MLAKMEAVEPELAEAIDGPVVAPAILELLRLRAELGTARLDDVLRYLTYVFCTYKDAKDYETSWMRSVSIQGLYPEVDLKTVWAVVGCGQLETRDRRRYCGSEPQARGRCKPSDAIQHER